MNVAASQSQDRAYIALLGLAEHFRTTNNFKKAIQCLNALFAFNPPKKVESRTHLQLGQLLFTYTNNIDLAKTHLEQAWTLSHGIQGFDDIRFDAAFTLSQLYQQQNQSHTAKTILRTAIENSQHNIYWHSKLLFQIARLHANDKEYSLASEFLSIGADCADENNSVYLKTQFLLNRAMILIVERKSSDVNVILEQAKECISTIPNPHLKEYSRVFHLILQVANSLLAGHVKSVKEVLKQLQRMIQTIINANWPPDEQLFQAPTDGFLWLTKEQLFVLVYVLTVSQSMISGFLEKTQKYTEKALTQIEKLRSQEEKPILSVFQVVLLEHIALCRLIMGNRVCALKELSLAKDICLESPGKSLLKSHSAQFHCLLGLYAMSINQQDRAEMQFVTSLQETNNRELKLFNNLNLAIIYMRTGQEEKLVNLLNFIAAEYHQPNFNNQALLGSYYWVQGLNSYYKGNYHEAKRFLRESLKMGNAEDLNRLTSCSLVLLSQVFLSIGNSKEAMNMVVPALQLASKIPDVNVQLWGSSIQRQLFKMLNDIQQEKKAYMEHQQYYQALVNDQYESIRMHEHSLLNWVADEPPIIQKANAENPSTSWATTSYQTRN